MNVDLANPMFYRIKKHHTINAQECIRVLSAIYPQAANEVKAMPFLNHKPQPGALEATVSLLHFAFTNPYILKQAIEHPITNADTPRIAALRAAHQIDLRTNANLVNTLLTPGKTETEEAQDRHGTRFAIVRPSNANPQPDTMLCLIKAAQVCKSLFNRPLPATAVILLIADRQEPGKPAENLIGSSIIIHPGYETPGCGLKKLIQGTLAHETAHIYWNNQPHWIIEGLCDLAHIVALNDEPPYHPFRYPGHPNDTASKVVWTSLSEPTANNETYIVGQRFFIELLNTIGHKQFSKGIGKLHVRSRKTGLTFNDICQAFPKHQELLINLFHHGPTKTLPTIPPSAPHPPLTIIQADLFPDPDTHEKTYLILECHYHNRASLNIAQYGPDGLRYFHSKLEIGSPRKPHEKTIHIPIGPDPGEPWKPGDHLILITDENGETIHAHRFTIRDGNPAFANIAGHVL